MESLKNNKKFFIIMICFFIVTTSIIYLLISIIKNFDNIKEKSIISLTYYDSLTPGTKNIITVHEEKIEVITNYFCSFENCNPTKERKILKYNKNNINKFLNFVNSNFTGKNIEVYDDKLTKRQSEVIRGLLQGEINFEINIEDYKYKIEYTKGYISYYIYFKDDKTILVKKAKYNKDYEIINVNTFSLDFTKENINILNDYIEKEVKRENNNIIYKFSLTNEEINIFNSIVENNEIYLNNMKKQT